MSSRQIRPITPHAGFTLVEALLSVALLALVASTIGASYITGLQSLDLQHEDILLDSMLRSRMEVLLSTKPATLSNGSETVTVKGETYTISWTIVPYDIDGDATPESDAWWIELKVDELAAKHTLHTIVVDNQGRIGKVS